MNERVKKILISTLDLGLNLVIILVLVFVIQKWIIAPFDVSGSSMCNTLNYIDGQCQNNEGEKIIINEAIYAFGEPKRGDIVVFKAPHEEDEEEKYFVKRVIGLPGETVEIKGGEVFINKVGESQSIQLEEPYLNEENAGKTITRFGDLSVFEVPEGQYFLLGDNRAVSTDSRSCFSATVSVDCKQNPEKAFIDQSKIRGKASLVLWPLNQIRFVEKVSYPELENQANSESLEEK